jgi:hypothetical protein
MNLFILDRHPDIAAQYHCDKHVVKMILETAQMLCTAHHVLDGAGALGKGLYKSTHRNHPCTVWVRQNRANYDWAYRLFVGLAYEYEHRYGKQHLTYQKLFCVLGTPPEALPEGEQTPFAQAMPDIYRDPDTVKAYRKYYVGEKSAILNWTRRPVPNWAKKLIQD